MRVIITNMSNQNGLSTMYLLLIIINGASVIYCSYHLRIKLSPVLPQFLILYIYNFIKIYLFINLKESLPLFILSQFYMCFLCYFFII